MPASPLPSQPSSRLFLGPLLWPAKVAATDNRGESKVKQQRLDEHKGLLGSVNILPANIHKKQNQERQAGKTVTQAGPVGLEGRKLIFPVPHPPLPGAWPPGQRQAGGFWILPQPPG